MRAREKCAGKGKIGAAAALVNRDPCSFRSVTCSLPCSLQLSASKQPIERQGLTVCQAPSAAPLRLLLLTLAFIFLKEQQLNSPLKGLPLGVIIEGGFNEDSHLKDGLACWVAVEAAIRRCGGHFGVGGSRERGGGSGDG